MDKTDKLDNLINIIKEKYGLYLIKTKEDLFINKNYKKIKEKK